MVIKSNKIIKLFSAGALIGAAFFSINHAQAEGGCPAGSYPTQGAGWRGCTPVYNNGGSSTPSRSNDDWSTPKPMSPEARQWLDKEINDTSVIAYWFDKKTQEVGYKSKPISLGDYKSVEQQFENQCAKNNRDCLIGYRLISKGSYHASPEKCMTIYKQLVNRGGTGLFSKPKYVEIYSQSLWDTPAEKINTYKGIKERKDIPVKDVCFN